MDGLERRLGRGQVRAGGEHDREVARLGRRARPAPRRPASSAASRASAAVERPVPMRTDIGHRRYSAPCRAVIVAIFGPTGVGKTAVAIALAERLRAEGEDPVAISADALQLYAGLEVLTGAPSAAEREPRSSTGCVGVAAGRPRPPAPGEFARARPRRDRRAARRRAAARSSSAAPACTCARRSPSSTCGPPRRPGDPRAPPARAARARRRARAARGAGPPRARGRRRDPPDRRPARHPRARAARRRPRSRPASPQLWTAGAAPPDAARRPHDGPRRAVRAHRAPASTRWSPPAPIEEVRAADAAGASPRRPPGARLRGSCSTATSTR